MLHLETGATEVDAGVESDVSSEDSGTSGDEVPVWIRGEQRWVSGVDSTTTCADLITVLLQDEATKVHGHACKPIYTYLQFH